MVGVGFTNWFPGHGEPVHPAVKSAGKEEACAHPLVGQQLLILQSGRGLEVKGDTAHIIAIAALSELG